MFLDRWANQQTLARLTKKKWKETQINETKSESRYITTDTTKQNKIKKNIYRGYYEQLYTSKLDNQNKTDKFIKTYILPRLNQ